MAQVNLRHGHGHHAEETREAILNAATQMFAEHGFDGARIDAIAAASGYNKSLIFQYFGDKLGLYAEVIRRADAQTREAQNQVVSALLEGGSSLQAGTAAPLFKGFIGQVFDFYIQNPHMARIFLWEMAEGWQTYTRIADQIGADELGALAPLMSRVQEAGLLHTDLDPTIQVIIANLVPMLFLASIPLFRTFFPGSDLNSPRAVERAREFVTEFVTRGLLANQPGENAGVKE
ncbi:MAG TPA: TetR/AcrR family transcriptional regulator [Anaerolineaceae bacterium]|nr:TetR/AcrR family transcriptional regulator [Anaerolineaceae bacterium]